MPVSNAAKWFVSGSEEKEFTYEGGNEVYNFCPNDYGLESSMCNNIIFFANDDAHAVDILKRLFKFAIECRKKYLLSRASVKENDTSVYLKKLNDNSIKKLNRYLKCVKSRDFKPSKVEKNFISKVGWANNDTCF